MNSHIEDTQEAWEDGTLGRDAAFAVALTPEELAAEEALIDEAMELKAISIRLEKSLIEDFKMIAALHGVGYQPLMRQALRRFADCEKKRILVEAYNEMKERKTGQEPIELPALEPEKKAA